jgi:hypothetical protein
MILQKIWSYITFKKQPEFKENEDQPSVNDSDTIDEFGTQDKDSGSYLRMMHGINRISIFMFIIGMIIVIIKLLR